MTPTPPASLVADLRAFDPSLRIRYGRHTQKFLIEKKLPPRHPSYTSERPNPLGRSPAAKDAFAGWREGYVVALIVPNVPELLNSTVVLAVLHRNALWNGGPEALNRRLDDEIAREDAAVDRQVDTWAEQGSKEMYDRLGWNEKRKVNVPVAVEDGSFTVTDRRTVAVS